MLSSKKLELGHTQKDIPPFEDALRIVLSMPQTRAKTKERRLQWYMRSFVNTSITSMEDIKQDAAIVYQQSTEKYDPTHASSARFVTYFASQLDNYLQGMYHNETDGAAIRDFSEVEIAESIQAQSRLHQGHDNIDKDPTVGENVFRMVLAKSAIAAEPLSASSLPVHQQMLHSATSVETSTQAITISDMATIHHLTPKRITQIEAQCEDHLTGSHLDPITSQAYAEDCMDINKPHDAGNSLRVGLDQLEFLDPHVEIDHPSVQNMAILIRQLGQIVPVVVTPDLKIVDGAIRVMAMRLLGLSTIRVVTPPASALRHSTSAHLQALRQAACSMEARTSAPHILSGDLVHRPWSHPQLRRLHKEGRMNADVAVSLSFLSADQQSVLVKLASYGGFPAFFIPHISAIEARKLLRKSQARRADDPDIWSGSFAKAAQTIFAKLAAARLATPQPKMARVGRDAQVFPLLFGPVP
jgi:hypothetical protein